MTLEKALQICMEECDAVGIPYGKVLAIKPSTRSVKRWGICRYNHSLGATIEINKALLGKGVKEHALLDTVMHELLHTCPGCQNHGTTWKKYAAMVNAAYGYNIKRTTSYEEKGMKAPRPTIKYMFKCTSCGAIVGRSKASSFTKHPEFYRCAKCHGKFIAL